jgi:hypothetical protein
VWPQQKGVDQIKTNNYHLTYKKDGHVFFVAGFNPSQRMNWDHHIISTAKQRHILVAIRKKMHIAPRACMGCMGQWFVTSSRNGWFEYST